MTFDCTREDAFSLVHYFTARGFPIDLGGGNVDWEECDVTLCDILVGTTWEEPLAHDAPVTCLRCLAEAHEYQRRSYSALGVRTGRMSAGKSNLGLSSRR